MNAENTNTEGSTFIVATITINATTHTFLERSFRDLSENVWVVASIVFGVYLENGKQSMLQPIHFLKDLYEIIPKNVWIV